MYMMLVNNLEIVSNNIDILKGFVTNLNLLLNYSLIEKWHCLSDDFKRNM